jgi:hypothetical protein
MSDTPTLREVLRNAARRALANVHVSIPAKVVTYDAEEQTVSARPLIEQEYFDEEGTRQTIELPIITRIPVVFPQAGGYRITFPIAVDDVVMLLFSEASIDKWMVTGGTVDPLDGRRHDINDAVAIPGLNPITSALQDAPTNRMSLGHDTGPTIEIIKSEDMIKLGSYLATEFLAFLSDVQTLRDELHQHAHTYIAPAAGAATLTTKNPNLSNPIGTSRVKAE